MKGLIFCIADESINRKEVARIELKDGKLVWAEGSQQFMIDCVNEMETRADKNTEPEEWLKEICMYMHGSYGWAGKIQ